MATGCVSTRQYKTDMRYLSECVIQLNDKIISRDGYIKRMADSIEYKGGEKPEIVKTECFEWGSWKHTPENTFELRGTTVTLMTERDCLKEHIYYSDGTVTWREVK